MLWSFKVRKGLRTWKSTVVLLTVLCGLVVLLLLVIRFVVVPVLVPDYMELLNIARSENKNGYWDYVKLSQKVSYLNETYLMEKVLSRRVWGKGRMGDELRVGSLGVNYEDEFWFMLAGFIRDGDVTTRLFGSDVAGRTVFLRVSEEILNGLRSIQQKRYFYPLTSVNVARGRRYEQLHIGGVVSWEVLKVSVLNACLCFDAGDYCKGLEWIRLCGELLRRFESVDWGCTHSWYLARMVSVLSEYPGLPGFVYEYLDMLLVNSIYDVYQWSFSEHYWLSLLFVENYTLTSLWVWNRLSLANLYRTVRVHFAVVPVVRFLKRNEPEIVNSTWSDVEELVYFDRGRLKTVYMHLRESEESWSRQFEKNSFPFSGCVDEFPLIMRNLRIGSLYAGRIALFLGKSRMVAGQYPEVMSPELLSRLGADGVSWLNTYLDVALCKDAYRIAIHSIPRWFIEDEMYRDRVGRIQYLLRRLDSVL